MTLSSVASNTVSAPSSQKPAFWELLWHSAGIQSLGLFVVAGILAGRPPGIAASPVALLGFYRTNHTEILIAAALTGLAVLNLLWFTASVRNNLAEAGKDGWGAAATASSAVFAALILLVTAIRAATAYSIADPNSVTLVTGLHDMAWALLVMAAFPRAMLMMSVLFGLWRAELISNSMFAISVGLVVLGVSAGTTWVRSGTWSPDGGFAFFASTLLLPAWIALVSWAMWSRRPAARTGW